jgi:hypothetical protein
MLKTVAGYNNSRATGGPFPKSNRRAAGFVHVDDIIGPSQAGRIYSMAANQRTKRKSAEAPLQATRYILRTKIIYRMASQNEMVMNEPHNAAHAALTARGHVMGY